MWRGAWLVAIAIAVVVVAVAPTARGQSSAEYPVIVPAADQIFTQYDSVVIKWRGHNSTSDSVPTWDVIDITWRANDPYATLSGIIAVQQPNTGEYCWLVVTELPYGTDIQGFRLSVHGVQGTTPSATFYVKRATAPPNGSAFPTQASCVDSSGLAGDTVIIIACVSVLVGMFVIYKLISYCGEKYTARYLKLRAATKAAEKAERDLNALNEMELKSHAQLNWKRVAIAVAFVRANAESELKYSFLPLVPLITDFVGVPAAVQERRRRMNSGWNITRAASKRSSRGHTRNRSESGTELATVTGEAPRALDPIREAEARETALAIAAVERAERLAAVAAAANKSPKTLSGSIDRIRSNSGAARNSPTGDADSPTPGAYDFRRITVTTTTTTTTTIDIDRKQSTSSPAASPKLAATSAGAGAGGGGGGTFAALPPTAKPNAPARVNSAYQHPAARVASRSVSLPANDTPPLVLSPIARMHENRRLQQQMRMAAELQSSPPTQTTAAGGGNRPAAALTNRNQRSAAIAAASAASRRRPKHTRTSSDEHHGMELAATATAIGDDGWAILPAAAGAAAGGTPATTADANSAAGVEPNSPATPTSPVGNAFPHFPIPVTPIVISIDEE